MLSITNSLVHGEGMRRARGLRGLSIEDAARRVDVHPDLYERWESGDLWPAEPVVRRLFGVGRETLMRLGAAEPER